MAAVVTPTPFQPGFRLVDGADLNAQLALGQGSTQNAITASATETRIAGTAITAAYSRVSSAGASDAVTLCGVSGANPSISVAAGLQFWIKNESGQTIQVFPPGASDTIDGGSAGAAVNLANASTGVYTCVAVSSAGIATWVSAKMAVSS